MFQTITELFEQPDAIDTLGEAFLTVGNGKALASYRKSLQLNPDKVTPRR